MSDIEQTKETEAPVPQDEKPPVALSDEQLEVVAGGQIHIPLIGILIG